MLEHADYTETNLHCLWCNIKGAHESLNRHDYDAAEKCQQFLVQMSHYIPDGTIRKVAEDEAILIAHAIKNGRQRSSIKNPIVENIKKYFCVTITPETNQSNVIPFPNTKIA